jgi:putative membrane protein
MQKRLWNGIAWPSMVLTWFFGLWLITENQLMIINGIGVKNLFLQPWFILKLVFVFMLSLYHLQTHFIYRRQQKDEMKWTSFQLRIWNEVATLFLFSIIFLVIPKPESGWVWAALGLVLFAIAIFSAVVIYKANRQKKEGLNENDKQGENKNNIPPAADSSIPPKLP